MKAQFLITILLCFGHLLSGQNPKLEIISSAWSGVKYMINNEDVSSKEFSNQISINADAFKIYKSGKNTYNWSNVLGFIGGGLIGWNLGELVGGKKDINWLPAGIGAGVLAVGIPLSTSATKKMKKGVELYNKQ